MEENKERQDLISCELDEILNQLSWKQLKVIIDTSGRRLRADVTRGGVRIISKNRKIILPSVKKRCLESEMIFYRVFVSWFNEQKSYHDCLSPFFQSDEHDELLKERGFHESKYVINDEYFNKFLVILRPCDINKFLLLSPVCFTSSQKELLEELGKRNSSDDTEQRASGSVRKSTEQSEGVFLTKTEWKQKKTELRKCREKIGKIEKLEDENSRLRNRQKEHNKEKADLKKQIDQLEIAHAQERKDRVRESEKKNVEMGKEIDRMKALLDEKINRIRNLETSLDVLQKNREKYFHQILSRLDTEKLLSELNAPDDVLELLGTVIRPPRTDEFNISMGPLIKLEDFWENLRGREERLFLKILLASAEEVVDADFFQDWANWVDDFIDLKCSLSARIYISDMIYKILAQYRGAVSPEN